MYLVKPNVAEAQDSDLVPRRRLERERKARKEAERLLEEKAAELYDANCALSEQAARLEQEVERRTVDLMQAKLAAERASRAKSAFLASMSHELRTPLHVILGSLDNVLGDLVDPGAREDLLDSSDSARRLLNTVTDILDFSQIEAASYQIKRDVFEPRPLVEELTQALSSQVGDKPIQVSCEVDPGLPNWVWGDRFSLHKLLSKLLDNALKFTESGNVILAVHVWPEHQLEFEVIDTGIGMSEEVLSSIFESFFQVDGSTNRKFEGTGLGLAISHRLALMMDSDICVESGPERGSRFTFIANLPAVEPLRHRQTAPVANLQGHVLVVDDQAVNLKIVTRMLAKLGLTSETVDNGADAVEKVANGRYDLVLMDVQMPGMTGLEATRQIRNLAGPGADTLIVALTAMANVGDREACLESGMDDYIAKPVRAKELGKRLSTWLSADN